MLVCTINIITVTDYAANSVIYRPVDNGIPSLSYLFRGWLCSIAVVVYYGNIYLYICIYRSVKINEIVTLIVLRPVARDVEHTFRLCYSKKFTLELILMFPCSSNKSKTIDLITE